MKYRAPSAKIETVQRFFAGTGATYDRVVDICTLGMDRLWKKKIVSKVPQNASCILDLACGTGILTLKLASAFPYARVVGVDVTPEYLQIARIKARQLRICNTWFVLKRAEDVQFDQRFDCIVSSYLAKYADLNAVLQRTGEMLREGGIFIMHDFVYPKNLAFSKLWTLYFKILQTGGKLIYPEWKAAFEGLPDLLRQTEWVQELEAGLSGQGFSAITEESMIFGTAAMVTAVKT